MGEKQNQPFQLSFNVSLKVDFQGSRVTSDGGLILVRELDERLGFGELIAQHLTDLRRGKNNCPACNRFSRVPAGTLHPEAVMFFVKVIASPLDGAQALTGRPFMIRGVAWSGQRRGGHHLAGLAVTALGHVDFTPCLLNRMRSVRR